MSAVLKTAPRSRVLVVDDDPEIVTFLATLLELEGIESQVATSAAAALSLLDRGLPSLVLLDIAMPDRDGLDLIRRVRARPPEQGGTVPAVAITAYARTEDTARTLSCGFQVHLSKPIDVDHLVTTVATLVGSGLAEKSE